uniref:Uncharacterized protein n=1 Tax=Anopheles epiroticus TaxID=199890 RepID=A0A182PM64_9DIPT
MNRHGGPNSSGRPVDPGHLYSALMSDCGQHPGAFVPGSNAFSLAHYQSMPNDQVDWAALAQQWIKMRETWEQPGMSVRMPSPPPPPSFDRDDFGDGPTSRTVSRPPPQYEHSAPADRFEEQGEAPMEVEREDDGDTPLPPQPPIISGGWSSADSAASWPSAGWPTTSNNTIAQQPPGYLASGKPPPHLTEPPPIVSDSSSAATAVALWHAKNSHLFQMTHPKDGGRPAPPPMVTNPPPSSGRRTFSAQPKPASRPLPGMIEREVKMGHSGSTSSPNAVPEGSRNEAKENFGSGSGTSTINEEKRMMLPAWIREGLEKMEREKQQKLKREQERRLWAERVESQQQSRFSLSPLREEQNAPLSAEESHHQPPRQQRVPEPDEAPPKSREVVELKEEDVEKMTKKILTEIFMETTNEVLTAIAKEELNKVQKRKAKQAVTVTANVGLATAAGGLGLGIYCDSDEDEEEEEEDEPGDGENKKSSGADNGSGNDSDHNSSDDDASDSEAMRRMMEKIRIRQQDFKLTAARIEKWLEDVCGYSPHAETEQQRTSAPTGGSEDGSEDGYERRERDREADELDSDPEQESRDEQSHRYGKTNNGFGSAGSARRGDEQQLASHEHVGRRRRDKRVSRFSDPRDTVRTTHITHVSILATPAAKPTTPVQPASKVEELTVGSVGGLVPTANPTAIPTANAGGRASKAQSEGTVATAGSAANSRLTAAQRSFNSYFNIPTGQTYQTIYSIGSGGSSKGKADQPELSAGCKESDGRTVHHERKKSSERDERDSYRRRHHRDRSHSRSSHSSRTSNASQSGSPDSRTSRSHSSDRRSHRSRSGTRHSSSSRRWHRYERDRSTSRGRSRSPSSRHHRHGRRHKRSRSRSRSRSSSKYSSRRRF